MATTKKKTSAEPKMTPTQMKALIAELKEEIQDLKDGAYCYICDRHRPKDKFYTSTDPRIKSGVTPICKDCAKSIALRKDRNGDFHEATKESIQLALCYLDKPFYEDLYSSSVAEASNEAIGKTKNSVWAAYVKNVAMPQYYGYTYKDSDMFKERIIYEDEKTPEDVMRGRENQDTYSDYLKNKKDIVRLIGYDPFEKENISDQPFLYSQLLGLLDASEDANDDMMRTASAISIVRGFLQQSKIDDTIVGLMSDVKQLQKNSATIKSLQDSKKQLTSVIKDLAAESCISLKNNKSTKKGENTWTGKMRKIKELNLRDADVNGFDVETCKGMQQVASISAKAIFDTLQLDESEYTDMIAEQRAKITTLTHKADSLAEATRILLRENLDLRDTLEDHHLLNMDRLIDLDDLLNTYLSPSSQKEGDN